jgi:hypothetical protein
MAIKREIRVGRWVCTRGLGLESEHLMIFAGKSGGSYTFHLRLFQCGFNLFKMDGGSLRLQTFSF